MPRPATENRLVGDSAKNSAAVTKASEAIAANNAEALREAAAGLGSDLAEIAQYLNEAADALDSYKQ